MLDDVGLILVDWINVKKWVKMVEQFDKFFGLLKQLIFEIYYILVKMDQDWIKLYMNDGYVVIVFIKMFVSWMKIYFFIVFQLDGGKKGIIYLEVVMYFEEFNKGKFDKKKEIEQF